MQLPTQNKLDSMSQEEFDSFLIDIHGSIDLLSEDQLQDLQGMIQKVEVMSDIEKARTNFATFVKLCGNPILQFSSKGQHHRLSDAFERVVDGDLKRLTVSMSPRQGKALSLDTPIPTPRGFTNIVYLNIGDEVFSSDGSICKVINVSPIWRDRTVYSVRAKGSINQIIADEKHEWIVNGDKYETRHLHQGIVFGYKIRLDDGGLGIEIDIEPVNRLFDTVCIEVDHPSHTFLAGLDSLPTCNSEWGSICLPAWAIGKNPTWKIIQASAGDKLATNFGRQVKAIIDSPIYKRIFPGITLSKDSKANSRFATNKGGMYYAVGVGTNLAGWGGDLICCDDLLTEQDSLSGNPDLYENIWTWVLSGPMQRLQPGGRLIHIATRWSKLDPIGKVQKRMKDDPSAEQYESIVVPALDENDESTFPEIWSTAALHAKRNLLMPHMWNAQYMQNPTVASGAIISRDKWKKWDQYKKIPGTNDVTFVPPQCSLTMMVMDTAYTNNKRSNPTAVTIWGCFNRIDPESGKEIANIILLHSYAKKMEFPELKRQSKDWIKEWEPDVILIEGKSSGPMLISELNQAGIPAISVMPKPMEDKISRLNSVTSVFASGRVWYLPTYANEATIEEVNDFPQGDADDRVDTVAYAVRHFRNTGMIAASDDREWEPDPMEGMRGSYYA